MNRRPIIIADAQAALGFVTSQTSYIERVVNETVYPDIQYPQLVPVDTSAPEWIKSVTYYSGDKFGAADWINGNSDDIPMAGSERTQYQSSVYTAGIGYGYGMEEIQQAGMLGIPLATDDASAARRAYEEFVDRIALFGDTRKNFFGITNAPNVVAGTAITGNWTTATADQILADLNGALTSQAAGVKQTQSALADTLLLPYERWQLISTRKVDTQATTSILEYFMRNNVYTVMTGRPLTVRGLRGLLTAGAGGTARMVAYRRDPSVVKLHIPMPHKFLPVFQSGPLRWDVPGIFRIGGVDVRRPLEFTYTDGI